MFSSIPRINRIRWFTAIGSLLLFTAELTSQETFDHIASERAQAIETELKHLTQRLENIHPKAARFRKTIADMNGRDWRRAGLGPKAYRDWNKKLISDNHSFDEKPSALQALVRFDRELKRRGVHLIVMPMPDHGLVYGHRLFEGLSASQEFVTGYTSMLIELADQDIEVVDLLGPFRDASVHEQDTTPPVLRPNDHHWGSTGMAIAAKKLGQRLQRYPWHHGKANAGHFSTRAARWDGHVPAIEIVYSGPMPKAQNSISKTREDYHFWSDWEHPVLLMGDSMVYHEAYTAGRKEMKVGTGQGFPHHLSAQIGSLVPFRGRAAGGKRVPSEYFSRFAADDASQPQVLVWLASAATLRDEWPQLTTIPRPVSRQQSGAGRSVEVIIRSLPTLPDPRSATYDDALAAYEVEFNRGAQRGHKALAIMWAMRERTILPQVQGLSAGKTISLEIQPMDVVERQQPKLSRLMLIDESDDLTLPRYWAIPSD